MGRTKNCRQRIPRVHCKRERKPNPDATCATHGRDSTRRTTAQSNPFLTIFPCVDPRRRHYFWIPKINRCLDDARQQNQIQRNRASRQSARKMQMIPVRQRAGEKRLTLRTLRRPTKIAACRICHSAAGKKDESAAVKVLLILRWPRLLFFLRRLGIQGADRRGCIRKRHR